VVVDEVGAEYQDAPVIEITVQKSFIMIKTDFQWLDIFFEYNLQPVEAVLGLNSRL